MHPQRVDARIEEHDLGGRPRRGVVAALRLDVLTRPRDRGRRVLDPAERCLPATIGLERPRTVLTNHHAGLQPPAAKIIGVQVQLAVLELEPGQQIQDAEVVGFDVLDLGQTSRAGVGEGEYADREQKSQRAPLDNVSPILLGRKNERTCGS